MKNKIAAMLFAAFVLTPLSAVFGSEASSGLQFAPNMRFEDKTITYRINDCPRYKWFDIETAFNKISGLTPVLFLPVASGEQMVVNCSPDLDKAEEGEKYGVRELGRGGPQYTIGENYNIIVKGEVLIEKDHDCEEPLVEIHEILHAMGYAHSDDKTSIMYPMLDCSQEVKREIIDDIMRLYLDASLPDLVVKSVTLKKDGGEYVATIGIYNVGNAKSGAARLIIRTTDEKNPLERAVELPPIEPGGGIMQTMKAKHVIKHVGVEILADFDEKDKENNSGEAGLLE